MKKQTSHPRPLLEQAIAVVVLALLVLYTYALFFRVPYVGFDWDPLTGRVGRVDVTDGLQTDDQLIQIGPVPVAELRANGRRTVLMDVQSGDVVTLVVRRDGQQFTLPWVIPGFNINDFFARVSDLWWWALLFWIVGQSVLLFLRPRDTRWRLLIAINLVNALWLGASTVSHYHLWESAIVLHAATWLWVPIYWHLHWIFPKPLGRVPALAGWLIYLAAIALAGLEWFQVLPSTAYAIGALLAVGGALFLLVAQFILQPALRRDTGLLLVAGAVALLPPLILIVVYFLFNLPAGLASLAVLFFPTLPLGYFYIAYRRQLGGWEVLANRLLSVYLFFLLLSLIFAILAPLAIAVLDVPGRALLVTLGALALTAIFTLIGFTRFQHLVERRLLGITLPAPRLMETYAARITTTPDLPSLTRLLTHDILPGLHVQESALLHFESPGGGVVALYRSGIDDDCLPTEHDIADLLAGDNRYRLPPAATDEPQPCPWVRLAIPLRLGGQPIGLWLLGRRDPDDFYSQEEIPLFQTLANQTTIALSNILQTERLRALYRAHIDQAEAERTHLARELHDDVLNRLAALKTGPESNAFSPKLFGELDAVIARIRQTIGGLRPASLDLGLRPALEQLADDVTDRAGSSLKVRVDLPPSEVRYDPRAEQHLFRIAQEACENVRLHARAHTLRIQGWLDERDVDLIFEDDGQGFALDKPAGLSSQLAHLTGQKHFGLAGMVERAALIGAELSIDAAPGRGTRVRVHWSPNNPSNH